MTRALITALALTLLVACSESTRGRADATVAPDASLDERLCDEQCAIVEAVACPRQPSPCRNLCVQALAQNQCPSETRALMRCTIEVGTAGLACQDGLLAFRPGVCTQAANDAIACFRDLRNPRLDARAP